MQPDPAGKRAHQQSLPVDLLLRRRPQPALTQACLAAHAGGPAPIKSHHPPTPNPHPTPSDQVLVALIAVPWMLFPKPFILKARHEAAQKVGGAWAKARKRLDGPAAHSAVPNPPRPPALCACAAVSMLDPSRVLCCAVRSVGLPAFLWRALPCPALHARPPASPAVSATPAASCPSLPPLLSLLPCPPLPPPPRRPSGSTAACQRTRSRAPPLPRPRLARRRPPTAVAATAMGTGSLSSGRSWCIRCAM